MISDHMHKRQELDQIRIADGADVESVSASLAAKKDSTIECTDFEDVSVQNSTISCHIWLVFFMRDT